MRRGCDGPSIPALVLLLAGLLPAGDAWYHTVAAPALSIQLRYAVPLSIAAWGAADSGEARRSGVSKTSLKKAAAAMALILEAHK